MTMRRLLKTIICILVVVTGCKQTEKTDPKLKNEYPNQEYTQEWIGMMIEGYRNFNTNRSIKAADKIFEATELMPTKNLENYLVSAMVYAPKGEQEKAFLSIERAIEEGFKNSEILSSISEYSSLHNNPRWDTLISKTNKKRKAYEKTIQKPELLKMLKYMWVQDQEVLAQYEKNLESLDSTATDADYNQLFTLVEKRWEINKNKLDSITEIYGWPGNRLVGEEGAKIAWGIPQHHPNVFFKIKCLLLIKEAMKKGDVAPIHYAQLKDRIARETWKKQVYGTSMSESAPYPIEDPANVNEKRSELGLLEPIEVYAIYHGFEYAPPSQEAIRSTYEKAQVNYKKFEDFIGLKRIDSANTYVLKAISAHGDITNEQLYNASMLLAQLNNKRSQRISLRILKVLIWRKWDKRFEILEQDEFDRLRSQNEWEEIKGLIKMSR